MTLIFASNQTEFIKLMCGHLVHSDYGNYKILVMLIRTSKDKAENP